METSIGSVVSKEALRGTVISENNGFAPLATEGYESSTVFVKDGKVYKLNDRNSVERQVSDIETLKKRLGKFKDRVPASEVTECQHNGKKFTCVSQSFINGKELKQLGKEELIAALKANKDFLLELLRYFFEAIEAKELYPDIVGYPQDPEYFNIINLMLDTASNKIMLCDVGLSPHSDTLAKYGDDFYQSENVKTYLKKMKKFQELLLSL